MRVIQNFQYTGAEQTWTVPDGVVSAYIEAWGAAGGMSSGVAVAAGVNVLVGGAGQANLYFTNNPAQVAQLGVSYANNAGYAAGTITTVPGESYYIYVGGNGKPGYSAIRKTATGYGVGVRGGTGGFNGGGNGGKGGHSYQNLYNAATTKVDFTSASFPSACTVGQLWLDTTFSLVRKCNTTYTAGNGSLAKFDIFTASHTDLVGPSGGGGGGATDFRKNANTLAARILVAAGGGGAGGPWNKNALAPSAWSLTLTPTTPTPPFGSDTVASGPTDLVNNCWATLISFLTGGWGRGGLGGAVGTDTAPSPTTSGGLATPGGGGGPATGRHAFSAAAPALTGSAGSGGTALGGGLRGGNGTATNGSSGQGGNGADATGGTDDFCAGGAGGGGGYFGGGGGGQGFLVNATSSQKNGVTTQAAGGGGGSNFAASSVGSPILLGGTRPPWPKPGSVAANGLGGFARVTFRLAPSVNWITAPAAVLGASAYNVVFRYIPAMVGGKGIDHYIIGTSNTITDTFPTSQTTVGVTDSTLTTFTRSMTAPASGSSQAVFVKVFDLDGDSSGWLKFIVTGVASGVNTPVTITAPSAGATFVSPVTVNWTIGTQTPLVAYRLGLSGNDPNTNAAKTPTLTSWRRGNSRINLAFNPGFNTGTQEFTSTNNANVTYADISFPGVSGANGKISWTVTTNLNAENHSRQYNNLMIGSTYRLHLGLASGLTNDTRQVHVVISDNQGQITSTIVDFSASTAGTYTVIDLPFTPRQQGVIVSIIPSSSTTLNVGDADAGQITYLKDYLLELVYEEDATGYGAYFDGGHLNGGTGTASWTGTASQSPSLITGTDKLTSTIGYTGPPLANGLITLTTMNSTAILNGFGGASATVAVKVNPSTPTSPTVTLNIDSANGLMHLSINAADGAGGTKTSSFDIFRNGVRIVTGLLPDPTTRIALYDDTPAHGVAATYSIRAWDEAGGYVDVTTGTVTGS